MADIELKTVTKTAEIVQVQMIDHGEECEKWGPWIDTVNAQWFPKEDEHSIPDHWKVDLDNGGGNNYILVYPYMYEGLKLLLSEMEKSHPETLPQTVPE